MPQQTNDTSRASVQALFKQHERQKADAKRAHELRRLRLRNAEVLKRMRELRRLRFGT